jgi:hypothetical protein
MSTRPDKIRQQQQEWSSKLRCVPGTSRPGYAHRKRVVEILEGDPSNDVLINCADMIGAITSVVKSCGDGKRTDGDLLT